MCRIEVICGITRKEIVEILREVLEELNIGFRFSENRFETEAGDIFIEEYGNSCLGLKLSRVVFPDERILKRFREKLMSKRAGG